MEPNEQQSTQAATKPVMDVVPPPKPAVATVPTDSLKTPPPSAGSDAPVAEISSDKKQSKQGKPKAAKTPHAGAGLAIVATVIIVLGLAGLFVYAYLRTNGVAAY